MLTQIAAFEARYQLRSPLFVMSFLIFFLLTFGAVTVEDIQIGSNGNTHVNSPYMILQTMGLMSMMAIFIVTAFVANVVIRDDETGFAPILRTTRVGKLDYLLGRFSGAMLVALTVLSAVPLAMLMGSFMPWVDSEKLGPLVIGHYVWALLVFGLPTLLVIGAGFFALATVTRSMVWSYIGAVASLVLYGSSRALLKDPSLDMVSGLADPFAVGTLMRVTKYWTTAERNTLLPNLSGMLLYNRLIWLGVAAALFALSVALFRFEVKAKSPKSHKKLGKETPTKADLAPSPRVLALPSRSAGAAWAQFKALVRFDMTYVFKRPAFLVLLVLGVVNALVALLLTVHERGVDFLPVTRTVVGALDGSFSIIPVIVAVFYAGELVWRDRERRMHEIIDASAAPNWAFMLPKVLALSGVLLACYAVASLTGVLFQLAHGFTDLMPQGYLLWFVLPNLIGVVLLAALAIFVQALVPNKAAGWGVLLVFMVLSMALSSAGFEHKLYNYAATPEVPLSDMNGMERFWIGRTWFQFYWLAFAGMLLVIAHLLWRRGSETRLTPRIKTLKHRLAGTPGLLLSIATLAWVGSGAFIFYNTNVLNVYETGDDVEKLRADYEKTLWAFAELPQPTIKHVQMKVELFPRETRAEISGSYLIENRSGVPLSRIDLQWDNDLQLLQFEMPGARLEKSYERLAHHVYALNTPMQPGETRQVTFRTRMAQRGFVNSRPLTRIVENGTFLANYMIAPEFGVSHRVLLQERAKRRKYGLPPEMRPAKLEDNSANGHSYARRDSDWVTADLTLVTDADQTPVAPGHTVSDEVANGRRSLVTRSDTPINNFFSMQSARFQVKNDHWVGKDGQRVQLQVYHHPQHDHNVQRMLDAMKVSLDVFSTAFTPYQFEHLRIQEFPAYERFAQAFAGTVPFSEAIGFQQKFDEAEADEKIDQVTFVTAHEVAHQWWAHQLIGANKQGMTLLSETFAQYSALLVMERLYGKEQIRKFLKFELDRYLSGRSGELVEELPLARVENQPYVHYRKGAVVMYGLKEMAGEEAVNRALRKLLAEFAFKAAPYPDSRDFLRLLRAEVGPAHEQLIKDSFENITLYDLKASEATVKRRLDGKYLVSLQVEAKKLYADGLGVERERPLNQEHFDIGVFSAEPGKKGFKREAVLAMERRPLQSGKQTVEVLVDREPLWVGVDPYHLRIDRNSDDNLVKVVRQP